MTYLVCQRVPWRRQFPFRNSSRRGVVPTCHLSTKFVRKKNPTGKESNGFPQRNAGEMSWCPEFSKLATGSGNQTCTVDGWNLQKNYLGFKKHHILRIINCYRDFSHQRWSKSIVLMPRHSPGISALAPRGCVPAGCPFKMTGPTTSCASRVGWCDVCSLGIFHTQETFASRELAMCPYKSKWLETVCVHVVYSAYLWLSLPLSLPLSLSSSLPLSFPLFLSLSTIGINHRWHCHYQHYYQ